MAGIPEAAFEAVAAGASEAAAAPKTDEEAEEEAEAEAEPEAEAEAEAEPEAEAETETETEVEAEVEAVAGHGTQRVGARRPQASRTGEVAAAAPTTAREGRQPNASVGGGGKPVS